MTRAGRRILYAGFGVAALTVAVGLAVVLTLRSEWFREQVRQRIVSETERASGGRVELGSFAFDWSRLRAEVRGFVLHGLEPAGSRPLLRADSISVGLRVVSALKRDIDLASVVIVRPEIRILVAADGSTNIPRPRKSGGRDPIEEILRLAVGEFVIQDGWFELDSRRIPLNVKGERLAARILFDATATRYQGKVSARGVQTPGRDSRPVIGDVELEATLERNRAVFSKLRLTLDKSSAVLSGTLENYRSPRVTDQADVGLRIEDAARFVRLPIQRQGGARIVGQGAFSGASDYSFHGRLEAAGLSVSTAGVRVDRVALAAAIDLSPTDLNFADLKVRALDGLFSGTARLAGFRRLAVDGTVSGFSVSALGRIREEMPATPWAGRVNGKVNLTASIESGGLRDTHVAGDLSVAPEDGPRPVEGSVVVAYSQKDGEVRFEASRLSTPVSRVEFNGVLGRVMRVNLRTSDLDDLRSAAAVISERMPEALPVVLQNGRAEFQGMVDGPLDSLRISGRVMMENFSYQGHPVAGLRAGVKLAPSSLQFGSLDLRRGEARLEGRGEISLEEWKIAPGSKMAIAFKIAGADVKGLLAEFGRDLPLSGTLTAEGQLTGTIEKPEAAAQVEVLKLAVAEEVVDRARAGVRLTPGKLEISDIGLRWGEATLSGRTDYVCSSQDWQSGSLEFEVSGDRLAARSFRMLRDRFEGFDGIAAIKAAGAVRVLKGKPELAGLSGKFVLNDITFEKRPVGSMVLDASTRGDRVAVTAAGSLRGTPLKGSGEWRLGGDYSGQASVEFGKLPMAALGELAAPEKDLVFDGEIQGKVTLKGPLTSQKDLQAGVQLEKLELRPRARGREIPQVAKDLFLRNEAPVELTIDEKGVQVRSARFTGRESSVEIFGSYSPNSRSPSNLEVRGAVNLALFSSLYPELVTSGRAAVNATIRGDLRQPLLSGRMELDNVSVFLANVPSGIENASGVVQFDRNRATIERLTAQAGGGQLRLTGFLGLGGTELTYRLQAQAEKVRIRYPEGVSTTVTGSVSLTGTSTRSLLAGAATIERAAFHPRTDIGSLLAESIKPISTPVPSNPVLAGMQFDIRVSSSPTLEVQTSLAKEIQAEADLRLRGSAAKPIVLGRVTVNQGEIQFFGNKYTITRGEIGFFNPARIEPVLDLDLETRVRGVIVNLSFTGPMSKLNMSYRSDPPLQSQEIIALLAVGRAPGVNPTQAGAQTTVAPSPLPVGTDSLIGQAIATPISSRLQRFFGVSRLKIDPHLSGTEITPQARLTIEQQISRDITLTYVTNLSEAKEQLVRVEWDLNRQWSVVAVRDENGVFGIDFLYKKRFR